MGRHLARLQRGVGPCVERSAGAIIVSMCSLAAIVWGVGILVRIPRRPVDPQGSSRYVLALGALLSLGCIFVAGRIPAFTCARGRFDDVLVLCMHPPSTSEPTSWLLLKKAVVVLGLLGGIVVSVRPRNVKLTAPVALAVWGRRVRLVDRRHDGVMGRPKPRARARRRARRREHPTRRVR
jgi:hypothetical protein